MLHPNSRTPLRDTPLRRNLGPRHLTARTRLVTATNAEKCESRAAREARRKKIYLGVNDTYG
ncbi:hypothetical protein NS506_00979 [Nocardia seriolae]|uniref:Uncharacterized protein n=1 Tax=Nocardia seriolae TaxID=37332 RepID=A0ABC8AL29_9NOCA|nr:hypothetical protein NS506_00979 [Nocardia seriolae]BEK91896.1 hypothetical protein NSERKGN1266_78470 [Nocardia seriolae]BEK99383.1 hypothetical protein NSER024013_72890 [Nocardia seriolae]